MKNILQTALFLIFSYACNLHKANTAINSSNSSTVDSANVLKQSKIDTVQVIQKFSNSLDSVIKNYKQEPLILSISQVNQDIERVNNTWYLTNKSDDFNVGDSIEKKMLLAKNILIKYQKKMYPKYRKIFAQSAYQIGLDNDMKIDLVGDKNEHIRFISYSLALHENKQTLFDKIEQTLQKYRFTGAIMTPYLGSEDGSIFTVNSLDDSTEIY